MLMRERIARVLYAKNPMYHLDSKGDEPVPIPWDDLAANDHPQLQAAWLEDVDAVLDTIREPTMEMCSAGGHVQESMPDECADYERDVGDYTARQVWQAMIDAATEDK